MKDNTERKYLHTMCKGLGLVSKSRGTLVLLLQLRHKVPPVTPYSTQSHAVHLRTLKTSLLAPLKFQGDSRYITVRKAKKAGNAGGELPRLGELDLPRQVALATYFQAHPAGDEEMGAVMQLATEGGGIHTAAELAKQVRQQRTKAAGAAASGAGEAELKTRERCYLAAQERRRRQPQYQQMLRCRQNLPAWGYCESILELIRAHQVVLVSGETGCGKSTQVNCCGDSVLARVHMHTLASLPIVQRCEYVDCAAHCGVRDRGTRIGSTSAFLPIVRLRQEYAGATVHPGRRSAGGALHDRVRAAAPHLNRCNRRNRRAAEQVPQFILDDAAQGARCMIACTQPRRISAIAVAERIAEERCEEAGAVVGYTIRLESAMSSSVQLCMMTPGVLLKKLNTDPMLQQYTHVIIDEVHERDKSTEFLLIVLRDLLPLRPELKVVLMSATLQQGKYAAYFGGCPITTIGARTFPVQEFFLEDVLLQTGYLDGAEGAQQQRSAAGRAAQAGGALPSLQELAASLAAGAAPTFACALCGRRAFRSAEELGTHVAMCFGGEDAGGGGGAGATALDAVILIKRIHSRRVHRSPQPLLLNGIELPQQDSIMEGYCDEDALPEDSPENALEDQEPSSDLAPILEDEADITAVTGVVPAKVVWDGVGAFGMRTADHQAEDLLARYQFSFDDEMVDYDLIAALLRYICESAYEEPPSRAALLRCVCGNACEEGAVLVFLPGWDDITRQTDCLQRHPYFAGQQLRFRILQLHRHVHSARAYSYTSKSLSQARDGAAASCRLRRAAQRRSGVPTKRQREVFVRPPPGVRKIILSTNIAETSVTIDDVAFVVDSGRAKEQSYDPHLKLKTLVPQWVSKASAKQRKGRAGRTKAGVCFHLFSARRHGALRDHRESELLCSPLEELCLQAKVMGLAQGAPGEPDSIAAFLGKAMDPPHRQVLLLNCTPEGPPPVPLTLINFNLKIIIASTQHVSPHVTRARQARGHCSRASPGACLVVLACVKQHALPLYSGPHVKTMCSQRPPPPRPTPHSLSVRNAVELLQSIGALDEREGVTDLGARLAQLSVDPRVGKMMLWAYMLGCAGTAVAVACAMSYKDPFVLPMSAAQKREAKAAKLALASGAESDLVALLRAMEGYASARRGGGGHGAAHAFADRNFLSANTLGMIGRELQSLGLPLPTSPGPANANAGDLSLLASVLCAGLYPNVAHRGPGATNFRTLGGHLTKVHQSSVNSGRGQRLSEPADLRGSGDFVAFGEITRNAQLFVMSNTTPVPALALLLLCGNVTAAARGGDEGEGDGEGGDDAQEEPPELVLTLDDCVSLAAPRQLGERLLVLRQRLHRAFATRVRAPARSLGAAYDDTVRVVVALLHDPVIARSAAKSHNAAVALSMRVGGGGRNGTSGSGGRNGTSGGGGGGRGGHQHRQQNCTAISNEGDAEAVSAAASVAMATSTGGICSTLLQQESSPHALKTAVPQLGDRHIITSVLAAGDSAYGTADSAGGNGTTTPHDSRSARAVSVAKL
ncbi:hypothetical protein JKP88DRAFT_262359 [Tribonema minus]|uniref:RNA helicase n=1 Tax=Tribonema minus TaxID=303371 RepID=A0A835Z8N8_9STRA|nr:hypothetical protein JKP88DRAFT_262359 [Tribonema minus]